LGADGYRRPGFWPNTYQEALTAGETTPAFNFRIQSLRKEDQIPFRWSNLRFDVFSYIRGIAPSAPRRKRRRISGFCKRVYRSRPWRVFGNRQYNLPIDSPGFYIYLREKNGVVWSPTWRPVEARLDAWCAEHEPGLTRFVARKGSVEVVLELFIPAETNALICDLTLTNFGSEDHELDVFGYVEFCLRGDSVRGENPTRRLPPDAILFG